MWRMPAKQARWKSTEDRISHWCLRRPRILRCRGGRPCAGRSGSRSYESRDEKNGLSADCEGEGEEEEEEEEEYSSPPYCRFMPSVDAEEEEGVVEEEEEEGLLLLIF